MGFRSRNSRLLIVVKSKFQIRERDSSFDEFEKLGHAHFEIDKLILIVHQKFILKVVSFKLKKVNLNIIIKLRGNKINS